MSNLSPPLNSQPGEGASAFVRMIVGAVTSGFMGWLLNHMSLAGIDFKTFGIDSEVVKFTLQGAITGAVVAPKNVIYKLRDIILSSRWGLWVIWSALRYGKKETE